MAYLVINTLEYVGDHFHYKSPDLKPGLNILEGANLAGKTTFMDLIYFGLSGNPTQFKSDENNKHVQIMNDKNNFVKLSISINNENYILKRFIDSTEITVLFSSGEVETYPIHRSKYNRETFSDWILNKLGIEVIEIFHGHLTWKLNFLDLFRLIYHDQEPNPRRIYKTPDSLNFVTDSELIRKTIFQMLVGKSYSDYYQSISEFKQIEADLRAAKSTLDEYIEKAERIRGDQEDLNLIHLKEKKESIDSQLDKLKISRESMKNNRPRDTGNFKKAESIKADLIQLEIEVNDFEAEESRITSELIKYRQLQENLIRESTQIQKIIQTHEELNLFSPDTCPYCLREVEREEGKCVCGNDIDEEEYERFFYDSSEYLEILKSKKKSVETINNALEGILEQKNDIAKKKQELNSHRATLKNQIQDLILDVEGAIDINALNTIDDKILELREQLRRINDQIEIEGQREAQQKKYDRLKSQLDDKKREMHSLSLMAEDDIANKIHQFNEKYNELMINSLSSCRSAMIENESYLPVINAGEYSGASASVSKRLNYYLTLLHLSLNNQGVKYPHFLMIDTPQTAGIDRSNLLRCLEQIKNVANFDNNFQIILTTAIDLYPEEFKEFVFETLTEDNKLLNRISN